MTLDEVRAKIDAIDRDLLRLLNERADCVNIVGEIKHQQGLEIYARSGRKSCCASLSP